MLPGRVSRVSGETSISRVWVLSLIKLNKKINLPGRIIPIFFRYLIKKIFKKFAFTIYVVYICTTFIVV